MVTYKKEMVQLGSIRKNSRPYDGVSDAQGGIGLRKVGKGEMERGSRGERGSCLFRLLH